MVSVDAIIAFNIMPAKELEHFFLRVCPAGGTSQQFCRALTNLVEIRSCVSWER
jgi:hypothetical protein